MPVDFQKSFECQLKEGLSESEKKKINIKEVFENIKQRKYLVLEDITEDDPNYKYIQYIGRRMAHNNDYIEKKEAELIKRIEQEDKEYKEKIAKGEELKKKRHNKVSNAVFSSSNPIRYVL